MFDRVPAGAYVIRNKKALTVLHVENPNVTENGAQVLSYAQDENRYQDQQIWWVEPLSERDDDSNGNEEGLVYSITNPSSGRSLDMVSETGSHDGRHICVYTSQGFPWQRWRFRKSQESKNGDFYNIFNVINGQVLDIANESSGANCKSREYVPGDEQRIWELVIPAVAFPPGWVQIQNVRTGDLLNHTYLHNPPILSSPPESPRPSQYREGWGFQWNISHSKCSYPSSTVGRNSWCIINRLTRGRLVVTSSLWKIGTPSDCVVAWQTHPNEGRCDNNSTWGLELDRNCNWKIINHSSLHLLEQKNLPHSGGTEVICVDQNFELKEGTKSWILRSPLLDSNGLEESRMLQSPPKYESPED